MRVASVLGALAAVLAIAGFTLYTTAPGVGDAERRVADILRRHGGQDGGLPLPRRLAIATIAAEDERFYRHGAVDPIAMARATRATITRSGDPGGSTITQQLAKVLYIKHPGPASASVEAIVLAAKLEQRYSKQRILEMYLNAVYYGDERYGAAAASVAFFGVPPSRLTWGQAALLAGLPQAPSAYDPTRHYALARQRQHEVLGLLVDDGVLSARQAQRAYDELSGVGSSRRAHG